jgi:hypothetical protein
MKLPLERIRSIECQSKINLVQLVTVNRDTVTAQFVTKVVRVETAFGGVKLPVNLIRRLTVSPAGKPGQMREGLVALWPGEGNANDIIGTNNGILENVAFTNGKIGQAFQLNHATSYITVPASPSLDIGSTGSGVTIECWVKPDAFNVMASGPIIEWDSATTDGLQLWTGGSLFANLKDTSGNAHRIESQTIFDVNNFQHVALTYDKGSGLAVLYINGVSVASQNLGSFTPQTTYPVNIGRRTGQPIGLNDTFGGLIDEISLYNRALSAAEIQVDYDAGNGGR